MKTPIRALVTLVFAQTILATPGALRADEGMWPFNMVPAQAVKDRWGFKIKDSWSQHAMKSSVRFNNGGSGSFVSENGLIMTNHHVGADCIQKLSARPKSADYMKEGFISKRREDELRCPDLEINVLVKIDDVTNEVNAKADALGPKASDAERHRERKAEMGRIEKTCVDTTGLRCDVITLYAGGAYHLYQYEKHTDVRLVFAPEFEVAFFGGDPDNFTYPRHCFDVSFFRAYEHEKPLHTPDHFSFSPEGARDKELVFVSGNPGSTDRFSTVAKLKFLRDTAYPFVLEKLNERRDRLKAYMDRGPNEAKAARDDVWSAENSIKALTGYQRGLVDPRLMGEADSREKKLIDALRIMKNAKEKKRILDAWPKLADVYAKHATFYKEHAVLEGGFGPLHGRLGQIARHLVRLSEELPKKSEERLREYRDTNLKSLELSLFSEAPIEPGVEIEKLALGLENFQRVLGAAHPAVQRALQGKPPRERAEEIMRGTRLSEVSRRREIHAGGKKAIDVARDSMIELVRVYDSEARAIRKRYEDDVESVERAYAGHIAEGYAKVFGRNIYPDATFTPRINPGQVRGYEEDGQSYAWSTDIAGMFAKHEKAGGKEPYVLPKRWLDAKPRLDLATPFNFVSTNDIIGGNSGSPVFNADSQIVGIIFDGNLAQLPNRFVYREEPARSISVHGKGILHVLQNIYGAPELTKELAP